MNIQWREHVEEWFYVHLVMFILTLQIFTRNITSEKAMLDDNWDTKSNSRLACQIGINKDIHLLDIEIAPES